MCLNLCFLNVRNIVVKSDGGYFEVFYSFGVKYSGVYKVYEFWLMGWEVKIRFREVNVSLGLFVIGFGKKFFVNCFIFIFVIDLIENFLVKI